MTEGNQITMNKKVPRRKFLDTLRQFGPTQVIMEDCYTAHPWGCPVPVIPAPAQYLIFIEI